MIVKWKIFRASFPYICTNCEEFTSSESDYCEKCGEKASLRRTSREDYEHYVEKIKIEEPKSRLESTPRSDGIDLAEIKRHELHKLMSIILTALLVIDVIGFIILMNILDISFAEVGENLWVLWVLVGFSLVVFIVIVILIYIAYYGRDLYSWIP